MPASERVDISAVSACFTGGVVISVAFIHQPIKIKSALNRVVIRLLICQRIHQMPKKLIEIASEIVQTQVSRGPMSTADIASSLRQVFSTLQELQKAETAGTGTEFAQPASEAAREGVPEEKPAITPENSIRNDKVICLECGAEMRQLTSKHLVSHGMNQMEYRKKYGFSMRTPLAAKSLIKARSKAAKKRGLPEKLQKYIEARRQAKAEAKTPPEASNPGAGQVRKVIRRRGGPKNTA